MDGLGNKFGALEEGRIVDISRFTLPVINLVVRSLQSIPSGGTLGNSLVNFTEHFRLEGFIDSRLSGRSSGPDVSQENGLTILIVTEGFLFEININGTS